MDLRLTGTEAECAALLGALAGVVTVRQVSGWYANRGPSILGRVYVDVEAPPAAVVAEPVRVRSQRVPRLGAAPGAGPGG
ncbi:MAG TPA: hypothetical protein VGD67_12045 [Pseudonocardiaceae bacterium]